MIDSLETILQDQRRDNPFSPRAEKYIRAGLRRELVLRLSGKAASLLAELDNDAQVREAVKIVGDVERYQQLLGGG